jgi:hypothetical protein
MDIEIVKLLCIGGLAVLAFLYVCWSVCFGKDKSVTGYRKEKSVEAFENWLQENRRKAADQL